jgi:hypothetical protein
MVLSRSTDPTTATGAMENVNYELLEIQPGSVLRSTDPDTQH